MKERKLFDPTYVDTLTQPMFFGEPVNISRFDKQKYPFIEQQCRKQMGCFWIPEEISLENDRDEFNNLPAAAQHLFTSNLLFQSVMDSDQGRGPSLALLPHVSLPELESFIEVWSFFEGPIHSRSYTHIIRNIYNNPSEVLDSITEIQELANRAIQSTKYYDEFINYANRYQLLGFGTHTVNGKQYTIEKEELYKRLYFLLMSIYGLEGIRFYSSFACSWAFADILNVLKKNAKIIKLIARDENIHMALVNFLIRRIMDGSEGEYFASIAKKYHDDAIQILKDIVQEECDWADYLFKHGSIIGLNAPILKDYIKFIANRRYKALGLNGKLVDDAPASNPLPWTEKWISGKSVQTAPQEQEIVNYIIGGIDRSVRHDEFSDMEL